MAFILIKYLNILMQDKKSIQKLYQGQNISIRKAIRQLDMGYDSFIHNQYTQPKKSDVNILVVGPLGAGKTTLLKTLHYALNGNLNCYVETRKANEVCYDRFEIKKNKRVAIEGLAKVKQTDEKIGIFGFQMTLMNHKNPIDKYARAVELMNSKTLGCIGHSLISQGFSGINYVLICLDMCSKIPKDELIALKFFVGELEEKKMKFNFVGSHLDQILGRDSNSNSSFSISNNEEEEKLIFMEDWKKFIQAEFNLKPNVEIYCMENYNNITTKESFHNSETINYYSLLLLEKCIKKAPDSDKAKKMTSKFFCF